MELWIRSQDKYTLMKIEEIQICENADGTWFMNAGIVLGRYKSKERALEILNEIQKHIEKQGSSEIISNENGIATGVKYYGKIYEMPKE